MSLSGAVPANAKYLQGGLPIGLDSKRRTIRLVPQTGTGNYTPVGTNVIRIDIPASIGFLDTQNSYLRFRIKINGDGDSSVDLTKPCFMDKNALSWCDRFEVVSNNGSVLESIHDYNLLVNLLHKATSPDDYRLTTGKMLDNQGSKAERMGNLAHAQGKQYCVGLDASGIFGGNTKYLPCQFIQGALTLEFTLASFADCFVGTHTASVSQGSYTITNVEYIAESISFGQDYNYLFEQQLRQSGIDISFHSYRSHHHSLQSATSQTIQLSQNSKSVKGAYVVIRDTQRYRSDKHESLSAYKSGRLLEYQFDLGGRLFPEFPINMNSAGEASAYANNLNSFNHFRDQNGGSEITRETFCPVNKGTLHTANSTYTNTAECTARFHGYLIANGSTINQQLVDGKDSSGSGKDSLLFSDNMPSGVDNVIMSSTIYFRPSSLFDLRDIRLGDRVKVCFNKAAETDALLQTIANGAGGFTVSNGYGDKETYGNATSGAEGKEGSFLFVVGVGLDVIRKHKAPGNAAYETIRGCVALAMTKDGMHSAGEHTVNAMMAVEPRSTSARAIDKDLASFDTTAYGDGSACYLDRIPDDSNFYIGQSFETHEEHEKMISGTDLTNTTPLHINMKFDTTDKDQGKINAPIKQGDLLTAFLHYDCVLRIEPDGSCVSSM